MSGFFEPPQFALPNNATCAEGTVFENLTVTERSQNGAPLVYKARTSIVFEPDFETAAGDSFETVIDPAAAPCNISGEMLATADMGNDGTGSLVAKDAYGFTLHYFDRDQVHDYIPVGATGAWSTAAPAGFEFTSLYNGNIAAMSVNMYTSGLAQGY